jgi:hypothetical protein
MFGAVAEMLGGIAVVVSLVFVGYQLRQQSYMERAKAQRDLLIQGREWISMASSDEAEFNAIRRCLEDFEGADAWSKQQFFSWATNVLLIFESVLYMKTDNLVHEGSYARFEQLVLAIVRTPGGYQWWEYVYNLIGTDVAEHIAMRIEEVGETVPPWNELLPHFKFTE